MDKLTALKTLANAYWYLMEKGLTIPLRATFTTDLTAAHIISAKFGYVRRSLSLLDIRRNPKSTEGMNGKMPTFF